MGEGIVGGFHTGKDSLLNGVTLKSVIFIKSKLLDLTDISG